MVSCPCTWMAKMKKTGNVYQRCGATEILIHGGFVCFCSYSKIRREYLEPLIIVVCGFRIMGGLIPFNILLLFNYIFHVLLLQSDTNLHILNKPLSTTTHTNTETHCLMVSPHLHLLTFLQHLTPDLFSVKAINPWSLLSQIHVCPRHLGLLFIPFVPSAPLVPSVLVLTISLPHLLFLYLWYKSTEVHSLLWTPLSSLVSFPQLECRAAPPPHTPP